MDAGELLSVARQHGLAVGLVADSLANEGERWVASIGLDASGAARTPEPAIGLALLDLDGDLGSRGAGPLKGNATMVLPAIDRRQGAGRTAREFRRAG